MNGDRKNMKRGLWWAVALLLVVVAQVAICLLLFVPQSRVIKRVTRQRKFVEGHLEGVLQTPQTFRQLEEQMDETEKLIAELPLSQERPAQEFIVQAVANALDRKRLPVGELKPYEEDLANPSARSWLLQCTGAYSDVTAFLTEIERQGVLLDVDNFVVERAESGGLTVQVVLKTLPHVTPASAARRQGKHGTGSVR